MSENDFIIEETAYHETRHAIASVYLKLPCDYVSIAPNGGELGHISYPKRHFIKASYASVGA